MKCKDIAAAIERLAPTALAYKEDNVGLLCGDAEQEVTRILLTLDVDLGVLEEAVEFGAQMIVAHHPIMYTPIQQVTTRSPEGPLLRALIQNNVSVYAAHTNLDIAKGGLNDLLAAKIGMQNVQILEYTCGDTEGIGRIGDIAPMSLCALAAHVKAALDVPVLRYAGDDNAIVRRVAVSTGGGTGVLPTAIASDAEVLITGDYKYPQVRDTIEQGLNIIDAGHYETEIIVRELFYDYLSRELGGAVEMKMSEKNTNVLKIL